MGFLKFLASMIQLTNITSQARQKFNITTEDGNGSFIFEIYYDMQNQGWYYNLIYNNIEINNLRLCTDYNILYQFQNQVPFGIAIYSYYNIEPLLLTDFSSGACEIYVLTKADLAEMEADIITSLSQV